MSKKNKNKFRKRIREQLLKEMSQSQNAPQKQVTSQPFAINPAPMVNVPAAQAATIPIAPEQKPTLDALAYIKHDLKKSAVIIGSIIIILAGLTVVNSRTDLLLEAGNHIFRVLHIGR